MYQPSFSPVPFRMGLYPIVDSIVWIKRLISIGVRTIQLRIKNKCEDKLESDIKFAITLCQSYNVRLFINDYWRLAIKHKAWGVHLGQDDLKNANLDAIKRSRLRLGISTHNSKEIDIALTIRPSYISLGHIFQTKTKKMLSDPQGIERLKYYVKFLRNYSTVAIGGINLNNIQEVIMTGVGSISVVQAITKAQNWKLATLQLLKLVGTGNE